MRYSFKSKVILFTTLALGVSHSLMCDLLDSDQINHSHSINQSVYMGADPEYAEDKLPLFKNQEAVLSPEPAPSKNAIVKTTPLEPEASKIEEPIEEAIVETTGSIQEPASSSVSEPSENAIVKTATEEPAASKIEEPIEEGTVDTAESIQEPTSSSSVSEPSENAIVKTTAEEPEASKIEEPIEFTELDTSNAPDVSAEEAT